MHIVSFTAEEIYKKIYDAKNDSLILDVRNDIIFSESKMEGPYANVKNISYIDFIEDEAACYKHLNEPKDKPIRVVCSKEGSAKYVGELLVNEGYQNVKYLKDGYLRWANLLIPKSVVENDHYQLFQFIRPGKASCSYGLAFKGELMLFDPAKNSEFYIDFAKEKSLKIVKTFETHLQADYVSGSPEIAKKTGVVIVAHEDDYKGTAFDFTPAIDGDVVNFKDHKSPEIKIIHTPGHTPGSTSYLIDNKYLISGDAIFIKSIGRPDLGGKVDEWAKLQFQALKSKIDKFDDQVIILPGHYSEYNEANNNGIFMDHMGNIRSRNNHIYGLASEDLFVRFIKDNMKPHPEVYGQIRLINLGTLIKSTAEIEVMDTGKNECAASQK